MNKIAKGIPKLLVLAALSIGTAHAQLLGTSVTGAGYDVASTAGTFLTTNFFDPANGYVPAGYGNSSSTTATIVNPGIEFALVYDGGSVSNPSIDSVTADFTASGLNVTFQHPNYAGGLTGFSLVFTDSAFSGGTFTKTADGFSNGGFTTSLVGDTLTLTVGPNCVLGVGCSWASPSTATWAFTSSVPEPGTGSLIAAGITALLLLAGTRRLLAQRGSASARALNSGIRCISI